MSGAGRKKNQKHRTAIRELLAERDGISSREVYAHLMKLPHSKTLTFNKIVRLCATDKHIKKTGEFKVKGTAYTLWGLNGDN